ncbi:MAG: 4'-phosphopantetheinyl transferase superfamily protein [Clostridiales bacterium]|nr:4'-phosphopantetheinyl transferase superfamily protein [Clostridiales bacterium]
MVFVDMMDAEEWMKSEFRPALSSLLSPMRRQEMESIRNPKAYGASAAAELLLRGSLKKKRQLPEDGWTWQRQEGGKPWVKELGKTQFNLSHSGTFAAVAWGDGPIGVDIQQVVFGKQVIAERCFSDLEKQQIRESSNPDQIFSMIWAAKEAYLKWLGTGLRRPLGSVEIHLERGEVYDHERNTFQKISVSLVTEELVLAVCADDDWDGKVTWWDTDTLFSCLTERR